MDPYLNTARTFLATREHFHMATDTPRPPVSTKKPCDLAERHANRDAGQHANDPETGISKRDRRSSPDAVPS